MSIELPLPKAAPLVLSFLLALASACSDGDSGSETDAADAADAADTAPPDGSGGADTDTASDTDAPSDTDAASDTDEDSEDAADIADAADSDDAPDSGDTGEGSGADASADAADVSVDTRPPECPPLPDFDYSCVGADPDTCPAGLCLFGQCLAPVVNAERWATCGDGACDPCEVAELCPVDCLPRPRLARPRRFDAPLTVTIEVHGFNPVDAAEFEETVYGGVESSGGMGRLMRTYVPDVPDVRDGPESARHMVGVEYYGAIPAEWLTAEDIAEIEANDWRTDRALHRYALVVAKFVRWYVGEIGATDVNLFCHSMGCHVTRYMLENDLEGVASSGVVARWVTTSGVIAGARLARLFDNPLVRQAAELLQMNTADFIHMNPDYVTDHSAWWDHDPHAANNPLFADMLIHHLVATDPTLQETFDILPLLDLNNPDDEPNDGLVYSWDEIFRRQDPEVRHVAADGTRVLPTATYQTVDHFEIKDQEATGVMLAAGLFHHRKAWLTVRSITLRDDFEQDSPIDFSQSGVPPAELSYKVSVSFDPYVSTTFGRSGVVVHRQAPEDRSTTLITLVEGRTAAPDWVLFEGPVFDDQTALRLRFELLEMDSYPRFGVAELALDPHDALVTFDGDVALIDGIFVVENGNARVEIDVRVRDMF